jgi:hypothetical protein
VATDAAARSRSRSHGKLQTQSPSPGRARPSCEAPDVCFVFVSVREGGSERGGELLRAWRKDANGCLGLGRTRSGGYTTHFFYFCFLPSMGADLRRIVDRCRDGRINGTTSSRGPTWQRQAKRKGLLVSHLGICKGC